MPDLLPINLNLPDYNDKLQLASEAIEVIKTQLDALITDNNLTAKWFNKLYEDNAKILSYLSYLSIPYFKAQKLLEETYKEYYSTPIPNTISGFRGLSSR